MSQNFTASSLNLLCNTKDFFQENLTEALKERQVETYPYVESYLVELLEYYLFTERLYDEAKESGKKTRETLAEMLLKANSGASPRVRFDLLKKLGDSALYISGFFGDSLQRKVVDVDYYIDMGATAYISLSHEIDETTFSKMYKEIAQRFTEFVDVLTVISRKTMANESNNNILRLMDLYAKTGSGVAQESLAEQGIFTTIDQLKKCNNQ